MIDATSPNGAPAPDDETLVRLARAGSRPACNELFQRHRGDVYRVAFRLLGNDADALDAVQDGFLKAFAALSDFDGRSGFRTWLFKVVSNAALDVGRKRGRRNRLGVSSWDNGAAEANHRDSRTGEPAADADPSQGLHREDLRQALDNALNRLSPTLRATFVLFAEAGLSYKEIADSQGVPIGTVMSRIHSARQKLQADVDPGLA